MSRELRFRVWDITFERMKLSGIGYNAGVVDGDDVEIMQYTGLKDKNGKKIYEGDIVSYSANDNFGGESGKCVVEWNNQSCGFSPFAHDHELDGRTFEIEILGNIYENPELTNS